MARPRQQNEPQIGFRALTGPPRPQRGCVETQPAHSPRKRMTPLISPRMPSCEQVCEKRRVPQTRHACDFPAAALGRGGRKGRASAVRAWEAGRSGGRTAAAAAPTAPRCDRLRATTARSAPPWGKGESTRQAARLPAAAKAISVRCCSREGWAGPRSPAKTCRGASASTCASRGSPRRSWSCGTPHRTGSSRAPWRLECRGGGRRRLRDCPPPDSAELSAHKPVGGAQFSGNPLRRFLLRARARRGTRCAPARRLPRRARRCRGPLRITPAE